MIINLRTPFVIHEMGQRQNQEDAFYPSHATPENRIFVLCDGMGGHEHGEVASQSVAHVIGQYLESHTTPNDVLDDKTINDALEAAFTELDKRDDGNERKMGTTLCIVAFHKGGATMAHIGDSRIYHVRTAEHRLLYMSRDHSLVMDLYRAGEIAYEEMANHPQKNIITRAMQPGRENRVRIDIAHTTDVKPGDYFYICSDGMLEEMDDTELCDIFCSGSPDEKKLAILRAATQMNRDNHTAWILHVDSVTAESGDETLTGDEQTSNFNALRLVPVGQVVVQEDAQEAAVDEEEEEVRLVSPGTPNVPLPVHRNYCLRRRTKPNYLFLLTLVALCAIVLGCAAYFFLMRDTHSGKHPKGMNADGGTAAPDTAYCITEPVRKGDSKHLPQYVPAPEEKAPDARPTTPQPEEPQAAPAAPQEEQPEAAPATKEQSLKEKIKKRHSEATTKDNDNTVSF